MVEILVKVAIIGHSGHMGRIHEATAREWGAEIVEPDEADVVVIASPDNTHAQYVLNHLMCGRAVFCEKPLTIDMKDIPDLEGFAASVPLGCHLPLRQFADELGVAATDAVQMRYDYGRKTKFLNSWRNEPDYDLVMGGGIHLMDLWMYKTGHHSIRVVDRVRSKHDERAKCADRCFGQFWTEPLGEKSISGTLTVDFTEDGPHRHVLRWRGEDRSGEWVNEKPTDKTYQLRAFLDKPQTDHLALASHRACLQFRETVNAIG